MRLKSHKSTFMDKPEKKPNALLNTFCFLLPFPVTIFLPAGITLLVEIVYASFFYDPYGHFIVIAMPIVYLIFVTVELALAMRFVKIAASPRSKAAARHLLVSTEVIAILFIFASLMILLDSVTR